MFLTVFQHQVRAWSKVQDIAVTELLLNLLIDPRKGKPARKRYLSIPSLEVLKPASNEVIVANGTLGRTIHPGLLSD
ncbi:MAG: hypothetical protein WC924_01970 [Candidatus Gracilibacteria bacterium]